VSVSIALKSDPAWDERGSGVGRREKKIIMGRGKISIWQLPFRRNCSQLKRTTEAILASHDLANCQALQKITKTGCANHQPFQRLFPEDFKVIWFI
jgi:hypothetical protein